MAVLASLLCLYGAWVETWMDPLHYRVTFEVSHNATDPSKLKIGDVITFNCTALNQPYDTATLEWMLLIGNAANREIAGKSPLIWTKKITALDHNTKIYCGTLFFDTDDKGKLQDFSVKSEPIALKVQGVTTTRKPPNVNGEQIWISVNPVAPQYNVGDTIEYVCNTDKMKYPAIEIRQVKGGIEKKVYFGYQIGHRWVSQNITRNDHGMSLFCNAWLLDERLRSYFMTSERFTINVAGEH